MVLRQGQRLNANLSGGAGRTRPPCALTHRTIEALSPERAPYRVPDSRCPGLAVRVAPSGLRTWDLAYRIRGTGKGTSAVARTISRCEPRSRT
jgi:hypothetical protein